MTWEVMLPLQMILVVFASSLQSQHPLLVIPTTFLNLEKLLY